MAISKINTPEIFDLGATNTSLKLPSGATDSRPTNPSTGQWRYNTDLKYVEYYDGNDWQQIDIEEECTTDTVNFPSGTTNVVYSKLNYSARDESSNNYDGTLGDITFVNGSPYSQAAEFNGTSSDIEFPAAFASGYTGSVTASIWFKTTVNSTDIKVIINSADGFGGSDAGFAVYTEQGKLRFTRWNIPTTVGEMGDTSIDDGFWHHLVIVLDNANGTLKVYLDNDTSNPEFSYTGLGTNQNYNKVFKTAWFLGQQASIAVRFFPGQQTQLRLISSAISTSQVSELYNEVQCPCTTNTIGYSVDAIGSTTNSSTEFYYKLDGNAYDATANANNGTWGGTEDYAVSPYGVAGVFDGSTSRINTGFTWPGGTEISCSLWINTAGGVNQYLLGSFDDAGANASNRFAIQFHSSNVLFILTNDASGGNGTTTNAGSITSYLNKWTHLVVTVNGTAVKAYLDGSLFHTSTGTALAAGSQPFVIGAYTDNSSRQNVNGQIDQVRLFSTELDSDQVSQLYNEVYCNTLSTLDVFGDSTGVALYQFNANVDSTDSSSNNGTWSVGTEAYAGGYFDRAADLNSSAIETPTIIPANDFSFSVWVNLDVIPASSSNLQIIYNVIRTSPQVRWYISVTTGGKIEAWNGASTFVTTSNYVVNADEWYHIVYTASSTTGKNIYVNGELKQNFNDNADNQGSSSPQWQAFGRYFDSNNPFFFDGKLEQARVFNKALTAFEVLQLYSE